MKTCMCRYGDSCDCTVPESARYIHRESGFVIPEVDAARSYFVFSDIRDSAAYARFSVVFRSYDFLIVRIIIKGNIIVQC